MTLNLLYCGCLLSYAHERHEGSLFDIKYCPLHKAAAELLAACEEALPYVEDEINRYDLLEYPKAAEIVRQKVARIKKAIAAAKEGNSIMG